MNAPRSIRWRLLLSGIVVVFLATLLSAYALGRAFERTAEGGFDRALANELRTLQALGEVDADGRFRLQSEPEDQHYAQPYSGHYWMVVAADRTLRSRSLWDATLDVQSADDPGAAMAIDADGPNGSRLRVLMQTVRYSQGSTPVSFLVAADRATLNADVDEFRLLAGTAVALVALSLLLLLAVQVLFALRPLDRLTQTAERVRRGEAARFPEDHMPLEVAPLARHLNELLDHHERSVKRARVAAQDLAHALKTPLAVLANEAGRPGEDLPQRVREQVTRMHASVERHLGRGVATDQRSRTSLSPVIDALLAVMQKIHASRALRFERRGGDGLVFAGSRHDLEDMLGNLLDNAGKWACSKVIVLVETEGDRLWISICDDGPGLPEGVAVDVIERGVRLDQQQPGSGFGLSIVRDLAQGYGGSLALFSMLDGFTARLDLPAA